MRGVGAGDGPAPVPGGAKMDRSLRNYLIDVSILITAALCTACGIIKWPGLADTLGISYASLPMEALTFIHDWAGILMSALAAVHVIVHWKWLVAMTKKAIKINGGKNEKA